MLVGACKKTPAPIPVPPPPDYFQEGEQRFRQGDYANAVRFYELYLKGNPSGLNRDRTLFYLALAYFFPGSPVRNSERAEELLKRLLSEFAESPYVSQVRFILGLQDELQNLRSTAREREEAMKRLQEELEQLKEIDMQRRR